MVDEQSAQKATAGVDPEVYEDSNTVLDILVDI